MVKGKPWTPATLRRWVAPREWVLTFLEETFSASTAPPSIASTRKQPRRSESSPARDRHRHQGADEITAGVAGSIGLCRPPQGLRRPDPILDPELRLITPTDPEGSSSEGQQTLHRAGNTTNSPTIIWSTPCGTGSPASSGKPGEDGRNCGWRNARRRGMPSPRTAILPSALEWANIRLLTKKTGLDRATAQDDEAGGAGVWAEKCPDLGSPGCWSPCRDRRSSPGHRESASHPGCGSGRATPRRWTHLKSLTSSKRCGLPPLGRSSR